MKSFIATVAAGVLVLPSAAFGVAYIKYDGVDGSAAAATTTAVPRATATASPATQIQNPTPTPQEASVDAFLKIDTIDGESKDDPTPTPKPQNVPAPGVEPDEIDYDGDAEQAGGTEDINIGIGELTPDFAIIFGEGSDVGEATDEEKKAVADILLEGLKGDDMPAEEVAFYYNKITTKVREEVKLFGVIPVETEADVEVDDTGRIKVQFPWWAFLASGKDSDELGGRVFNALSNVLKTKHDTIKNSIGNIR